MKHENDVSDMTGCLQVVRIYIFMKEKNYKNALRASSFSLLSRNIILFKKYNIFSMPSKLGENLGQVRENSFSLICSRIPQMFASVFTRL